MHTIMIISGGLVLLALFVFVAKSAGLGLSNAMMVFIPVWFACAAVNMWIGISRAGYTFAQEFPIFLVVFAVPAVIALALLRRPAR